MNEASTDRPPARSRSWVKWVALGCGGLVVLGALAAAAILLVVLGAVKQSDVYREAVDRARSHPDVVTALGEPVEPGWFVSGSVNVSGPSGEASLAIPLEGPAGEGTLYVEATKEAGTWRYQTLEVAVEGGGPRIDLLGTVLASEETAAPGPAASGEVADAPAPAVAPGPARIDRIVFGLGEGEALETADRFPAGVPRIYAGVEFSGLDADDEVAHRWYRDGEKVSEQVLVVGDVAAGEAVPPTGWLNLHMDYEEGFPPGEYRVDVWLNGRRVQRGTFRVE